MKNSSSMNTDSQTNSVVSNPQMHIQDVGDWFVHAILASGITQSFGYPGAAIEPLYNALSRAQKVSKNHIGVITLKHETAAAFAAEGYYRVAGKVALCCATAGPGAANLAGGLASAAIERIPILVVTGNPSVKDFGRGTFQDSSAAGNDIDTVALLKETCNFSALVTHPAQLPHLLYKALAAAQGESPGPVHLSIPLDIFRAQLSELDTPLPPPESFHRSLPHYSRGLDEKYFQDILELLLPQAALREQTQTTPQKVSKACLVIGGGCKDIANDLMRVASQLEWDMIATPTGKGLIDHNHPYFKGVIGLGGHPLAYETLAKKDQVVIIIGTRFDESETGGWYAGDLCFDNTIQIDNNPNHFFCYYPIQMRYLCDLQLFTQKLEETLLPHAPLSSTSPISKGEDGKPSYVLQKHWDTMQAPSLASDACIKPQVFMNKLIELTEPTTPICSDSGSAFMWTMHLWPSIPYAKKRSPNNFHVAMGLGMMGWSPGASIGVSQAQQASGDQSPCICIVGDGAFLMSSQEIGTAAQFGLNIAFFIINNASLGIVEHCQKILGAEPIAYELPQTNFALNASAFNIPTFRITNANQLESGWDTFMNTPGPALFDLLIDHQELPPLGFRLEVLGFKPVKEK